MCGYSYIYSAPGIYTYMPGRGHQTTLPTTELELQEVVSCWEPKLVLCKSLSLLTTEAALHLDLAWISYAPRPTGWNTYLVHQQGNRELIPDLPYQWHSPWSNLYITKKHNLQPHSDGENQTHIRLEMPQVPELVCKEPLHHAAVIRTVPATAFEEHEKTTTEDSMMAGRKSWLSQGKQVLWRTQVHFPAPT